MTAIEKKNVGIFIFDSVEVLDFAGPYEVFSCTRLEKKSNPIIHNLPAPFNTFTISERRKNIITTGGQIVKSKYNFKTCPELDILIIPGGVGTRKLLSNKKVLKWIVSHSETPILASVCTGSLLLAKAQLLVNRIATTHWGALDLLKKISPTTKIINNRRFTFDKYYTSSGVSAGIDMSLFIVEKICGKKVSINTAKYMEYKSYISS